MSKYQLNRLFLALLFLPLLTLATAQENVAFLTNPSFEDEPRKGGYYSDIMKSKINKIEGWIDCGKDNFENESAPDIHAESKEYWKVKMYPSDGETFLGMVIRDNFSWEEVSQKLINVIRAGQCYQFTIDLAKADPYISHSRMQPSTSKFNYNTAAILKIWGGQEACEHAELLYTSEPVNNQNWQTFTVDFCADSDIQYISFQVYYTDDDAEPYNGNILVDNISTFQWTGMKR